MNTSTDRNDAKRLNLRLPTGCRRRFLLAAFFSAIVYILLYCVLSMNGSYAPTAVGLEGVITYDWAPLGFYKFHPRTGNYTRRDVGWNSFMIWSFCPLWYIDIRLVHPFSTDGRAAFERMKR